MRFQVFLAAAAVFGLAYAGREALDDATERLGFTLDALKLGGALLICGLFSLKAPRLGVAGAGVVALIGASLGIRRLAVMPLYWLGWRDISAAELLTSGSALICLLLAIGALRHLLAERGTALKERGVTALKERDVEPP